jgi:hypothetical protein
MEKMVLAVSANDFKVAILQVFNGLQCCNVGSEQA